MDSVYMRVQGCLSITIEYIEDVHACTRLYMPVHPATAVVVLKIME
jgi:hypothetical protein